MRAIWCWLALTAVAGLVLTRGSVQADEETIPLDKLPKSVAAAVKKRFPKAEWIAAAKETDGKKTEYEVILKNEGQKIDVTLTPEGMILQMEKEISAKDLPKAVTKTLKKSYPKAVFKRVEEFITVKDGKETLEFYEVLLGIEKKTVEVKVDSGGKIISPLGKEGDKKDESKETGRQRTDLSHSKRAGLSTANCYPHLSLQPAGYRSRGIV